MKFHRKLSRLSLTAAGIGIPVLIALLLNLQGVQYGMAGFFRAANEAEEQGKYHKAFLLLDQLTSYQPYRTDLWIRCANIQLQQGKWEDALQSLLKVSGRADFSVEGQVLLGEAYRQTGKYDEAAATWSLLMESEQAPVQVYGPLAQLQRRQGDYREAMETLSRWKEKEPENPRPMLEMGFLLTVMDGNAAVRELDAAGLLDKNISKEIYPLRKALKAVDCSPVSDCQIQIGLALAGLGQWDVSAVFFEKGVEANSDNAEAWAFLGEAQQQLGGSGREALETAMNLDPESTTIRALMSLCRRREKNLEKAFEIMEGLAAEEPERAVWQIEMGSISAVSGNLKAAREYFQKAVDLDPENAAAWKNLARFSLDYGMDLHETGLPAARQALLLEPADPELLTLMGNILFDLGDLTSAERFLLEAVRLDEKAVIAHLLLGQIDIKDNNLDQAVAHLQKAIRMSTPAEPAGILARRLMEEINSGNE